MGFELGASTTQSRRKRKPQNHASWFGAVNATYMDRIHDERSDKETADAVSGRAEWWAVLDLNQ